jgi:hypothetical protein
MAEDLLGLGKAAEALVKQFAELARPLLEPAAKEAGDILADQLRYIRLKSMVASMERARKLLDEKGIAPKMVPSKIFFPILEGVFLEDENDLAAMWARLLASAAGGGLGHPSYPAIFSSLAGLDARLLDTIYRRHMEQGAGEPVLFTLQELGASVDTSGEPFTRAVVNLKRSDLCNAPALPVGAPLLYTDYGQEVPYGQELPSHFKVRLTSLGYDFVRACQGPQP